MVNQVRYRRVATHDEADEADRKRRRGEAAERISTKIQALFWVLLAGAVLWFTDLPRTLLTNDKVDRLFLNIAVVCFVINSCIVFYLGFWLEHVQRVTLSWDVYCPRMIPTATVVGITYFVAMLKAMWPVYGFLSPLILFVLFLGMLFITHFIPFLG